MSIPRAAILSLPLLWLGVLNPTAASAKRNAGDPCFTAQIISIQSIRKAGDVLLFPVQGEPHPARNRECLEAGQTILVLGTEPAQVRIRLRGAVKTLTARSGPFRVPDAKPHGIVAEAQAFFRSLGIFLTSSEPATVETYAKKGLGDVKPTLDPLLADTVQRFPDGADSVTVLWRGPGANVTLAEAGHPPFHTESPARRYWATISGVRLRGTYDLRVGEALKWRISTTSAQLIPEPRWKAGAKSVSDEERIARAVWILVEGPASWRLFALSELQSLATSSYGGERVWEAVRLGELH